MWSHVGTGMGWRRSWSPKQRKGFRVDKSIYVHCTGYLKSLKIRKFKWASCEWKPGTQTHKELKKLCSSWSPMASCLLSSLCICFTLHLFCSVVFSAFLWGLNVVAPQPLYSSVFPIKSLYCYFACILCCVEEYWKIVTFCLSTLWNSYYQL